MAAKRIDEELPEEFVMPAGPPATMFPPVGDLVFKRDHGARGVVYRADVTEWFRNGYGPKDVKPTEDRKR